MKMKLKIAFLAILALTLAGRGAAFAVTADGGVSLTAEVTSIAELTLGSGTIDFPNNTPTSMPSIPGSATTSVTANIRTGAESTATLTAVAGGDLVSGLDSIPIGNVTSSYTGAAGFFTGGAIPMSTTPVSLGSSNNSGSYTGIFTWALANDWTYKNGAYAATISYVLTAP